MIVPGTDSQALASAIARQTGLELAAVTVEHFPDGELLVGIPGFDADEAILVASTTTSRAHLEVLQLQDAIREAGASSITTVLPYMGYARQDKPMAPGSTLEESPVGYPISARAMARAISTGTDRVLVVNPHEEGVLDFFDVPAIAVDATSELATGLPDDLEDPLFVAPDKGARDMATAIQSAYGNGSVDYFAKTRLDAETVSIEPSDADPGGRDVVIVDDIIATGGTVSQAVQVLTERNASRVFVTCVHGILAERARTRIERAGVDTIVATDTIEDPISRVSVAPLIADALDD